MSPEGQITPRNTRRQPASLRATRSEWQARLDAEKKQVEGRNKSARIPRRGELLVDTGYDGGLSVRSIRTR